MGSAGQPDLNQAPQAFLTAKCDGRLPSPTIAALPVAWISPMAHRLCRDRSRMPCTNAGQCTLDSCRRNLSARWYTLIVFHYQNQAGGVFINPMNNAGRTTPFRSEDHPGSGQKGGDQRSRMMSGCRMNHHAHRFIHDQNRSSKTLSSGISRP